MVQVYSVFLLVFFVVQWVPSVAFEKERRPAMYLFNTLQPVDPPLGAIIRIGHSV